jgi:hypothetical protein
MEIQIQEESRMQKEENRKQKCISAFHVAPERSGGGSFPRFSFNISAFKKSVIRYSLEKLADMAVRAPFDFRQHTHGTNTMDYSCRFFCLLKRQYHLCEIRAGPS